MADPSRLEEDARKWLVENASSASVVPRESGDVVRLDVTAPCGSFYVSPPEKPGEPWVSENGGPWLPLTNL